MKNNEAKCFCPNCVNLSICTVKAHRILQEKEDEVKRLKKNLKDCFLDEKTASGMCIILGLAVGVFLGYAWHYGATHNYLKNEKIRIEKTIIENENQIKSIMDSKQYQAVLKCGDEDWQAECIAWEMKNAK